MRSVARLVLTLLVAAPVVASAVVTPAAHARTAGEPLARATVVVTLVDDLAGNPVDDRPAAARAAQDAVLADLGGADPADVRHLTTGNVVVAEVTQEQRQALTADPRVAAVGLDRAVPVSETPPTTQTLDGAATQALVDTATTAAAPAGTLPPVDAPAQSCTGTQASPQLEPEALGLMNVRSDDASAPTAAALGYDGAGVKIGIITTNLDPQAPNFIRPDGSSVVVDYRAYGAGGVDAVGAAGEAFGDASSIGAQGVVTSDLADVVNPDAVTLPGGHCWIRIVGVAPAADLVVSDVHDQGDGNITIAGLLQAVDYSVTEAKVDVISESLIFPIVPDAGLRSAIQAVNAAAVDAGVTVVASSGDAGPNSTIGVPAALPGVISVGATTSPRIYAQVGALGISRFGNGSWTDGATASFSSSGTTMTARTIDLVAPGFGGWSTCSGQPRFLECDAVGDAAKPADLIPFAGTSQSAPFVAGIAALVIQAYRDGHDGTDPSPDQVRRILTGTATDLGLPAGLQGNGQVDARAAVLAARNLPGADLVTDLDPAVAGGAHTLVADVDQLTATRTTDLPIDVTVTNTGSTPVDLTALSLTQDQVATRSTQPIDFAAGAPAFLDGYTSFEYPGIVTPLIAGTRTVDIPEGVPWARLQVLTDASVHDDDVTSLQVSAFGPDGTFVNGGISTSGIALVLPAPRAGRWTVVVQTAQGAPFTGVLALDLARRAVVATPTASTDTLAPGSSARITAVLPVADSPGDRVTTLRVAGRLAIPVVLRRPADLTTQDAVTLSVPLLPTAGRDDTPQQTATWSVDVPAGRRSLSAVLSSDAATPFSVLVLVDPDGNTVSISSSADANTSGTEAGGIQSSVAAPRSGRWTVTALVYQTLYQQQAAVGVPLTVDLSLDATRPVAVGLPQGAEIAQGAEVPVTLQITNPGGDTLQLVGDARTDALADVALTPVAGGGPVTLPVTAEQPQPVYLVPQFSESITASAVATVPVVFGLYDPSGSRNAVSAPGTSPTVGVRDRITPGPWDALFNVPGAVVDASPAGTATTTATVRTAAFDTSVTGADGTPWMSAAGPATQGTPIAPGATAALSAVLHVDAAVGTRVTGFLAVETPAWADGNTPFLTTEATTGDVLGVFPYSYVVGPPPSPDPTTTDPSPSPDPTPTDPTPTPDPTSTPDPTPTSDAVLPTDAVTTTPPLSTPVEPTTTTSTATVTVAAVIAPPPTGGAPATPGIVRRADGSLAHTGADVRTPVLWGVLLLVAGGSLIAAARRRRAGRGG